VVNESRGNNMPRAMRNVNLALSMRYIVVSIVLNELGLKLIHMGLPPNIEVSLPYN
jgi:hypothetical protein